MNYGGDLFSVFSVIHGFFIGGNKAGRQYLQGYKAENGRRVGDNGL
jgi:hypothetical protein